MADGQASQPAEATRPNHAASSVVQQSGPVALALRYLAITAFCAISLLPVYAAIVTSLTEYPNVGRGDLFPSDWAWHNYLDVWSQIPLAQYMLATLIYALSSALGCVVIGTLAAYALSRLQFHGKQVLLYGLLVSQVIPLIVLAIPLFALIRAVGLFDSYVGIWIVIMGIHLAFPIMFLKSYLDGIPRDMEEAAQVDGCNQLQAMVWIVLPSAKPALFTTFALVFFTSWQTFLIPLILTSSDEKTPVTVGVFRLLSDSYTPWQFVMAASIIASIPPIAVFLIAQRQLIGGLTAGAVK
jgi:ABC-type glycerol-3-phosphate transport system permease component